MPGYALLPGLVIQSTMFCRSGCTVRQKEGAGSINQFQE